MKYFCLIFQLRTNSNTKHFYYYQFVIFMFTSHITSNLALKIAFFTSQSARQTTPNLIKNPILSKRGIVKAPPKSYAYDLHENLPNRHLYWDNKVQNRLRRKLYNAHRLYKLGIRPIHDDKGTPLHNRSVQEVLYQLSNLRLIKESLGRTLINLREIVETFPDVMRGQDKKIAQWAVNQINDRNLPSMNHYEFSTYCYLRQKLHIPASEKMLVHLYKWIEGEAWQPSNKIKPKFFLANMKYIFETASTENLNDIFYKQEYQFSLFEDVPPSNKVLSDLLPKLFTQQQIVTLKSDSSFKLENYSFLMRIPGGKGLYDRLQKL